MKKIILFFMMLVMIGYPSTIAAQSSSEGEEFTMPKKDGRQGDKIVQDRLIFYDMGGPSGNTVSYYAGYTRFVPSSDDDQIIIQMEMIDLGGNAYLYIYDGDIDFTSYSSDIPEGYLAKLNGNEGAQSFTSTSGSLSVLYHCKGSGSGQGWKAIVEAVPSKDQEWVGVDVSQANLPVAYPAKKKMPIMYVNLKTDGGAKPFTLSQIAFDLMGNIDMDKLSNLRLIYTKGFISDTGEEYEADDPDDKPTVHFSLSRPLSSGNNYFSLVADIADDAPVGTTIDAVLRSVVVGGEEKIMSPLSAEGYISLASVVNMEAGSKTVMVSDSEISFYDDGGVDGNISEKFSGQVTFVPTTPGKKVELEFRYLDLFNTSTTGMNDILTVYNGASTDDKDLIETVLKDLVTVHSTSADGSLTVKLVSTTGMTKAGFEAYVREFVPTAMQVEDVAVSHPSVKSVCAGSEDIEMLLIDIKTLGTEPPVSLAGLKGMINGDCAINKVNLYSLGSKIDGVANLVGSKADLSDDFYITLSSPIVLSEYHNYFLLTCDLDDLAAQSSFFDMSLVSLTTNVGNMDVTDGSPEGNRMIDNVFELSSGTHVKTIAGSWKFRSEPSAYSYYGYDGDSGNRKVTFVPHTTGSVIELDFTKFAITFPSYSYGSDPSFVIYDGSDSSGEVLWRMTKADKDKGPGIAVRATNPEGALTVEFNPNGQNGASSAGFEADLREYVSKPMTVSSVTAMQTNTDIIRPSAEDVEILCIDIVTDGDLNPVELQDVVIDMKGSQDKVDAIKIFYSGSSPEFSINTKVGEIKVDSNNSEQILTLNVPVALAEKHTYFHLAYDMLPGLDSDLIIDAALKKVKISDNIIEVDSGDPEGNRLTKNIMNFDGKSTVTVKNSLLFYDDGGPDGKYTSATSGLMVFVPEEGKILRMTFNEFWTNYQDHLYVYDGIGTEGKLLADLSSSKATDALPTVIAKSESGALTVEFNPVKNNVNSGWSALIEAFVPQPLTVSTVEVTPVNDVKMLRGSGNNKMLKVKVSITGDKGEIDLKKFCFSALDTEHEAVTSAKLWYTGTDPDFGTFDLYGETTCSEEMEFVGSRKYDEKTEVFFWLSYDISTEIESESKVQAHFVNLTSNDTTVGPDDTTDALLTVQDGIHGIFSIGTSGDYDFSTINEAVASLEPGIDGPVVFEIADGNYRELVNIPKVVGASDNNTITMRSASGKRDKVVITYDRYTDPGSSNYDKRYGIFTLDGVSYFTLENVTVTSGTYTGFPGIVFVRNASRHCTVKECAVKSPESTDAAKGTNLVYMYSKNEANCNSDYFTLKDCILEGGYIGMYLQGTSYVALPKQVGGRVTGNKFMNQGSKAIYVSSEQNSVIQNNSILSGPVITTSYSAMDLNECQGDIDVSGNTIFMDSPKGSATGMYVRMYNATTAKEGNRRIYNNEINMRNVESAVTGIRVNNDIPELDIVYNTISIVPAEEVSPNATGVFFGGSIKGGMFKNNIVQNLTKGYGLQFNRYSYLEDNGIPVGSNVIYCAESDKLVYVGGTDFAGAKNFEDWVALGFDITSYNEFTGFLSDNVLEPADKGNLLNACPIEYIATDLYGASRDQLRPTIGAYEYAESTVSPVMTEGYPVAKDVGFERADISLRGSLTSRVNYIVLPANDAAPDIEDVAASELSCDLRKGVEETVTLNRLKPKTSYRFYALLTSLRGMKSEQLYTAEFTTTYLPTTMADFEESKTVGSRIEDGTFSFTGFEIRDITDGVVPLPNNQAAFMTDDYAVIQLTNADNLPLEGFFVKNSDKFTITTKDSALTPLATKTVEPNSKWTYINLRDMGNMTYIELETDGNLGIDNFGGTPSELSVTIGHDVSTRIAQGASVTLPAVVTGGVAPFSYSWTIQDNQLAGDSESLTITPDHSATYFLTVTDAHGNIASARTTLLVTGSQYTATFDDLYLAPDSYWYAYTDEPDYTSGTFFSGSFGFNNNYISEWNSWNGFAYSDMTSTSFSSYLQDQYNSAVGHGVDDSANFGVAFISNWQGATEMTISNTLDGESVEGMWVTNTAWVVDAILNGDGMEGSFEKGDWLKLVLTGIKADGSETKTLEFLLADYSSSKEADRWYLHTWQWVDMKPLGDIVKVRFDIQSSKRNVYGVTTPTYVCIDNVGSGPDITEVPIQIVQVNEEEPSAEINLEPFFSFDAEESTVTYALLEESEYASIEGDILTIEAPEDIEFSLNLRATQRGCSEYVMMPVRMQAKPLGIDRVTMEGSAVYPNPASDHITVTAPTDDFVADLYSVAGIKVASGVASAGKLRMDVSAFAPGAYIVKVTDSATGVSEIRKLLIVR